MIIYKKGDILQATENLICHQVNENGVMGGGLALQIATQYPMVEVAYRTYVEKHKDYLLGDYQVVGINKDQSIVNCFTQENFNTRCDLIEKVFSDLVHYHLNRNIAIPYKYGCGIAKGDWNKVLEIMERIFKDERCELVIYKRDEDK